MKTIPTQINRKYTVSSTIGCTITDSNGSILCNVAPNLQTDFTAISNSITADDESAIIALLFYSYSGNCIGNSEGRTYTCGAARLLQSNHILDLGELPVDTDLNRPQLRRVRQRADRRTLVYHQRFSHHRHMADEYRVGGW